jgi:transposase
MKQKQQTQTAPVRKAYPSDLRDAEWALLESLVPAVKRGGRPGGRPARHSRREIVNAILYVVRGGNQWRAMPHDLPPWQTAFYYFRIWRNEGTWEQIHTALRERSRRRLGREATPSAAILDSQSVKTSQRGARAASTSTSR